VRLLKGNSLAVRKLDMLRATTRAHIAYAILVAASVLAGSRSLAALVMYAWRNESSSHILLVPFISLCLIWLARKRIFAATRFSIVPGAVTILSGAILFRVASLETLHVHGNGALCLSALALVVIWVGGFLLCYGPQALRAGMFSLLFLLLMVPIPEPVLDRIVHLLQQGSTEIAYLIFRMVGVPVLRQGFVLSVPGVAIEVAKECSSIRSSMALFITCLLAAHLYLRTWWKALLFVLLTLPFSVIKNGIRIATLTLLSLHVNPDFLRGRLHREGGFVFFLLTLLMLWPVFVALERSDQPIADSPIHARARSDIHDRD
jgi:exosortase